MYASNYSSSYHGQIGHFDLSIAAGLEEGKFWNQTCLTPLKNWPCLTSSSCRGVSKYIYKVYLEIMRMILFFFFQVGILIKNQLINFELEMCGKNSGHICFIHMGNIYQYITESTLSIMIIIVKNRIRSSSSILGQTCLHFI